MKNIRQESFNMSVFVDQTMSQSILILKLVSEGKGSYQISFRILYI